MRDDPYMEWWGPGLAKPIDSGAANACGCFHAGARLRCRVLFVACWPCFLRFRCVCEHIAGITNAVHLRCLLWVSADVALGHMWVWMFLQTPDCPCEMGLLGRVFQGKCPTFERLSLGFIEILLSPAYELYVSRNEGIFTMTTIREGKICFTAMKQQGTPLSLAHGNLINCKEICSKVKLPQ